MEQDLTFEIIGRLSGEELHTRALARNLKINHMAVVRRMKELVDANVVNFRQKGRNKVYFLKKTVEARNYSVMAELYKLNKALKAYPVLRSIIEAIQKNISIRLAILFGSYAKGIAEEDSDIDIFIETKERDIKMELENLNSRLSVKIGDFDRSNPLIREIEENHVIIKGIEQYYEKAESI